MKKATRKIVNLGLALSLSLGIFTQSVFATELAFDGQAITKTYTEYNYEMTNPYADVDWETYGQYKANLHAHSTASDGSHTLAAMIEAYYAQGYDILGMADHGTRSNIWTTRPSNNGGLLDGLTSGKNTTVLTQARYNEIMAGVGRDGRGMTQVINANEQNPASNHVLSYYSTLNTSATASNYTTIVQNIHNRGDGYTVIAHPGRETGGPLNPTNTSQYRTYIDLFNRFDTLLGYEISGKQDGETYNDRILWDYTLMEMAPKGRNIFGFANDDSHATTETGRNWMMFLMPENTEANVKKTMATGAFYSSSRYARPEGVDARQYTNNWDVPAPAITNIIVDGNTIMVEGAFYNTIEWIADGKIIATGNEIDLVAYKDVINSYIRFQLKGEGGISWAQPMLLILTETEVEYLACIECGEALAFGSQNGNCYANGFDYYACECGYWFYAEVYETIGHGLMLSETRPATCEADGAEFYICTKEGCDHWEYGKIFPSLGHDLELVEVDGQWFNVCQREDCGYWEYAELISAAPTAFVTKLNGDKNDLTITITEKYFGGTERVVAVIVSIDNNAAGTYELGGYKVYVDTKGNTQIRECYIVK